MKTQNSGPGFVDLANVAVGGAGGGVTLMDNGVVLKCQVFVAVMSVMMLVELTLGAVR